MMRYGRSPLLQKRSNVPSPSNIYDDRTPASLSFAGERGMLRSANNELYRLVRV